jgi:hypothetical protein
MAEISVPDHLSLEGRATMIADETGRTAHAGKPDDRRAHVKAVALAHLRAAIEQAQRVAEAQ